MAEREFLAKLKKSFKANGAYFYKIADMPHFKGANFRFDLKKPFDAFAVYKGVPIAIEAKFQKNFGKFSKLKFQDHQIPSLLEFERAGGVSFVFLNIKIAQCTDRILIFSSWDFYSRIEKGLTKKELLTLNGIEGHRSALYPIQDFLESVTKKDFINVPQDQIRICPEHEKR